MTLLDPAAYENKLVLEAQTLWQCPTPTPTHQSQNYTLRAARGSETIR